MLYNCSPVPTRGEIVITRWFSAAENVLVQNSTSASLTSTQQVIFMDCLQVAHIWHSKRFVTFICCHPVYLYNESPTPKVSLVPPTSWTSDWRGNPEWNLRSEELNKNASNSPNLVLPTHISLTTLLVPAAGANSKKNGVEPLLYLNNATFMFFLVQTTSWVGLCSAHTGREWCSMWGHIELTLKSWLSHPPAGCMLVSFLLL